MQEYEKNNLDNALNIFRWIGFLPLAILAAWIAWIVVYVLGRLFLGGIGINPNIFQVKLYFVTIGHAAMSAAFVYVGAKIAPAHRVFVAFVLGGVGIVVSGFLLFPAIIVRDWWAVWGGLCVAIGAGTVVWAVYTGTIKL